MMSAGPSTLPSSLHLGFDAIQPSNATTPTPSWAHHSQHPGLMFPNPTWREPRLFPTTHLTNNYKTGKKHALRDWENEQMKLVTCKLLTTCVWFSRKQPIDLSRQYVYETHWQIMMQQSIRNTQEHDGQSSIHISSFCIYEWNPPPHTHPPSTVPDPLWISENDAKYSSDSFPSPTHQYLKFAWHYTTFFYSYTTAAAPLHLFAASGGRAALSHWANQEGACSSAVGSETYVQTNSWCWPVVLSSAGQPRAARMHARTYARTHASKHARTHFQGQNMFRVRNPHSLTHAHTDTVLIYHTHTHEHALSLSLTPPLSVSLSSPPPSLPPTLSQSSLYLPPCIFLSLSLSLSFAYTHTHTHKRSHPSTHTHVQNRYPKPIFTHLTGKIRGHRASSKATRLCLTK